MGMAAGWVMVPNRVLAEHARKIGPVGIAVYAALRWSRNQQTGKTFPSTEAIARLIGASRWTVMRALEKLLATDLVTIEKREGRSPLYHFPAGDLLQSATGSNLLPVATCTEPVADCYKEPVADCYPNNTKSNKTKEQDEKTHTPRKRTRRVVGYSAEFLTFWVAYPRKVAKADAWRRWQVEAPPLAAVLAALAWQIPANDWTRDRMRYIPHPATYLHDKRWEDEQPAALTHKRPQWIQDAIDEDEQRRYGGLRRDP